jgi:hypothetical protein
MFTSKTVIAAILAGVIGTLANSVAVSALFGAPLMGLIFSFGRLAVAILVALLLIPIFARMERVTAWITALVTLTVLPSLLAKTVFGAAAPLIMVLGVNAVYAVAATLVYVLISRRA